MRSSNGRFSFRRYEHTRSGITATVERRGPGSRARIDPQQLLQILLNLVVNAEQAVAGIPGAEIVVGVSAEGEGVEITVSDNGPGLPPETEVTAPFATTRGPSAAGLGLTASNPHRASMGGRSSDGGCGRKSRHAHAAGSASRLMTPPQRHRRRD